MSQQRASGSRELCCLHALVLGPQAACRVEPPACRHGASLMRVRSSVLPQHRHSPPRGLRPFVPSRWAVIPHSSSADPCWSPRSNARMLVASSGRASRLLTNRTAHDSPTYFGPGVLAPMSWPWSSAQNPDGSEPPDACAPTGQHTRSAARRRQSSCMRTRCHSQLCLPPQ